MTGFWLRRSHRTLTARVVRRVVGHSHETPRRFWVALPGLGELRLYRWGIEVYIGPKRWFVALGIGTAERMYAEIIRSPA